MKKFISILFVLIISLFTNTQIANTLEENLPINENMQSEQTKDNNINDDSSRSDFNEDDIFGDEQTFPFVAGLGKNAAH
tara:strand:+ start:152 stop:388 length:237 start_codon:yes stop_codon:yes gene_type:complete